MAKDFKEHYYNLEEDEVQELIAKAQAKDNYAQTKLLQVFENFLNKYVKLLYVGNYNLNDYDTRRFIALFVKDSVIRAYLLRNKLTAAGQRHVSDCIHGVQYMAQRYGDEEDIRQTVQMTFLQCVNRYKPKESAQGGIVPFKGFIWNYFYYLLKKNVDAFLIDQLGRKTFPLLADDDHGEDGSDEITQGFHAPADLSVEDLLAAEEIDEYWVAGDTAMTPFDMLTIQERQLLKWRYVDGQRASEIARRITEHSNTTRDNLQRIRAKITHALQTMDI